MNYADDERRSIVPKSSSPFGEARISIVCGVAPPRRVAEDTPSSSRLASNENQGFQCAHYLAEAR